MTRKDKRYKKGDYQMSPKNNDGFLVKKISKGGFLVKRVPILRMIYIDEDDRI